MKIERVVRHYKTIYFRTTSDGVSHQWAINWRPKKRYFRGPSWVWALGKGKDELGNAIKCPTWAPPIADLERLLTDEDRAALLAISMRLARSGED